jgi:hypothetical protein
MLIWQGWGLLAAVLPVAMVIVLDRIMGRSDWSSLVAVVLGAVVLWFLGRYLNSKADKKYIVPETGEEVVLVKRHTLFFIPMQYWAIPWLVGDVYFLLTRYQFST